MSFIQTAFLFGGLAVGIPVLVHLLSRWQVQRVELGTMRFMREVIQDGAQRRRIRRWLLLLTRMAAVALLAFLFARPYLPESIRRDGGRMRVVLIDRSASMGMPGQNGRLIDDAVEAAREAVGELGTEATIRWAWFDHSVHPIDSTKKRLQPPRSIAGDTNYLAALSWARDQAAAHPDDVCDVVLISDFQQTGLASDPTDASLLKFPQDVPVQLIDVGRTAASNLAVVSVATHNKRITPGRDVIAAVTLFNYGELPMEEIPLTAVANDGKKSARLKKSINVGGGQALEVEFDFGKLEAGLWKITVSADWEDDLVSDNTRITAVDVAASKPVWVIDGGTVEEDAMAESYFLSSALKQSDSSRSMAEGSQPDASPSGDERLETGRFAPRVLFLSDDDLPSLSPQEISLVVVANSGSVSSAIVDRLQQYVGAGGRLMVFAGDGADAWKGSQLVAGEVGLPQRSGAMPFRIQSIDDASDMMLPFADPQHGDLSRLAFQQILPITLSDQAKRLASFDNGMPALSVHAYQKGQVAWFYSSADSRWSNWINSPLYLPLVHQMAADLLDMTGEGLIRFRSVGDARLVARGLPRKEASSVTLVSKRGAAEENSKQRVLFESPGFEPIDSALYVVNTAPKESDTTRIEQGKLAEHYELSLAEESDEPSAAIVNDEKKKELWPLLAAAAMILVIGEFFLSNRTTA